MRLLVALMFFLAGCGLFSEDVIEGEYAFANRYGYTESVVVRPDYEKRLEFGVEGRLTLKQLDGRLTGSGTCTRSTITDLEPEDTSESSAQTQTLTFSGDIDGRVLTSVRVTGCAYPRVMYGRLEGGRIVLETDLDFPVSRGTTIISDRFGDPTRLVLSRSEG